MHRVIAAEREAGDDGDRRALRRDRAGRHRVLHDAVVCLGVDRAVVNADAGAAVIACLLCSAEALDRVGFAGAALVLKSDEESAFVRLVVAEIFARPGVGVDDAVRRDDDVPRVADAFGENRRAETGRQLQPGVVCRAAIRCSDRGRWCSVVCRRRFRSVSGRSHHDSGHDHQNQNNHHNFVSSRRQHEILRRI